MSVLDRRILGKTINDWDLAITKFMNEISMPALRFSIGVVFVWFGILKPFGLSSALELVENTIYFIPPEIFVPILGIWEVMIGISLIIKKLNRLGILLLFTQMIGTFLPLIILPEVTWSGFLIPTLEGQYIIKNLVLISSGLVIGSQVRNKDISLDL
ncbi:MAG: DoxX family membrane protein [Candidatus Heimdallarchaeota archaeon]|nr:DoxX family membrane protein [Candidatus Heimdallarchaeota archaeon]